MCQVGLGEDRNSLAAFLFTWPDGNTSKPAIKLPKARIGDHRSNLIAIGGNHMHGWMTSSFVM